LLGYSKEWRDFGKSKRLLLTVFDLIDDLTAVMGLVNSVDTCRIIRQLVPFAQEQRDFTDNPMFGALSYSLGFEISFNEDFKCVSAIFFLRDRIDTRFKCFERRKIVKDPLSNPITLL
jgi:hypothetical protein